mgnify:CR=1 FL=1
MAEKTDSIPTLLLDQLNLVVADMDATLAFYRLLGLDIPEESVWRDGAGAHCNVKFPNGFDLEFASPALARAYDKGWSESEAGSGRVTLSFRTVTREEVDALFATLTAVGHAVSQPPYDAFWGSRYAIVHDPDGNPVGIMSEPDPKLRKPPPRL